MASERKRIYEFEKEHIEIAAIKATEHRKSESFVMIVLDLMDRAAKQIAIAQAGSREKVESHIEDCQGRGVSPSLIFDTSYHDAGVFFEKHPSWNSFIVRECPSGFVPVAVVADGGTMFTHLQIPT